MKRLLVSCFLLLFFCGCNTTNTQMDESLSLRQRLLKSQGCKFTADISADYQESLYRFSLECAADANGHINFTVLQPDSISNIKGSISKQGGKLTFEDKVLAFPLLADGVLSPVSGPWIFLHAMRSGYIQSCGSDAEGLRISINDTYSAEVISVEIYLNQDNEFRFAEVFWQGRRIMSIEIKDFVYV